MTEQRSTPRTSRAGRSRLRNEIVGGALIVTLSVLVLFGWFVWSQAKETRIATVTSSLEAVASIQEARLDTYAQTGVNDLALVVSRNRLKAALAEFNRTGAEAQVSEIESIVASAIEATPDVESIHIYDPGLELVTGPEDPEAGVALPESYLEEGRTGTASGLITPSADGTPVHLVVGPIVLEGELVGVAAVAQSTEALRQLVLDQSGLGNTGETIVAQPREDGAEYIAPLRFDTTAAFRPVDESIATLPMIDALEGIESTTTGIDYRGSEVLAATRLVDATGWGIVVKMDRSEAFAPIRDFALVAAAGLAVALVVAYFVAARSADLIIGPIRKLTETASEIASGRRDLRVGSNRNDEVGEMATAFDEMTSQLNSLTAQLEERVEERTRELEEKNAQLARLMQEKETFLAGVSHEVRSPLTAMIGFIELVNQSGDALDSEERTEMLETVSRQADDVLNLIEDLLASARAEAGTLKVVSVRVDLAAQARQVVEAMGKNARVEIDLEGNAQAVADPARVRQIIRNLLTNADRYGGDNVEIVAVGDESSVAVEVRDDGEGVPEEDRKSIFEAYGQSDSARSVHDSVGLGLHVSLELARLMGGDLVYRYEDGWSVFRLTLPAHIESEAHPDPKPQAPALAPGG